MIDDLIGIGFSYSVDQAACEILSYPVSRGRELALEFDERELAAVLGVVGPGSNQELGLATLDFGSFPHHGHFRALVISPEFANQESVFLIVERNPLEYALEGTCSRCVC